MSSASVGDLRNNLKILQNEIRHIKYPEDVDFIEISKGKPQAFLPIYHYVFSNYSPAFAEEVVHLLEDSLYGKSDLRFMESIYKVLRDLFKYKPIITKDQFFSIGTFAERKIMMCTDILRMVRERVRFLEPNKPTNPSIKVSSVVDSRRNSRCVYRPQSAENVSQEPSANFDSSVVRKTTRSLSRQAVSPTLCQAAEIHLEESHNRMTGYARPKAVRGSGLVGGEEIGRPSSVRAFSPQNNNMEAYNMPQQQGADVLSVIESPPLRSLQSDAMTAILAKVRDLPAQLANFMQAVENRLQYMEEKLQESDSVVRELRSIEAPQKVDNSKVVQEDQHHELETLKSRVLLLENRLKLIESKIKVWSYPEVSADEKTVATNPFVPLERGGANQVHMEPESFSAFCKTTDDSFASILIKDFSPIRREDLFANETMSNAPGSHVRRSSTPTHKGREDLAIRSPSASDDAQRENREGSLSNFSFHALDTPTQNQVERIRGLLQSTRMFLPGLPVDNPVSAV